MNDNKKAWIDFPAESLSFHIGDQRLIFEEVTKLTDQYHAMNKQNVSLLVDRSQILERIAQELDVISNRIKKNNETKIIKSLSSIARRKAWYLGELRKLYGNNPNQYMQRIYRE